MRMTAIAAALAIVGASALSAQAARPETTFVKGTVTGDPPMAGATITGSRTVYLTLPPVVDTMSMSTTTEVTSMSSTTETSTVTPKPRKKTLDRKISHGVKEAAGDASKLGKKAGHGVKEAASDVKKKVTGKP